jgi:hypothetical protein
MPPKCQLPPKIERVRVVWRLTHFGSEDKSSGLQQLFEAPAAPEMPRDDRRPARGPCRDVGSRKLAESGR